MLLCILNSILCFHLLFTLIEKWKILSFFFQSFFSICPSKHKQQKILSYLALEINDRLLRFSWRKAGLLLVYFMLAVMVKWDLSSFPTILHNSSTPSQEEVPEWPPNIPVCFQPRYWRLFWSTSPTLCMRGTGFTQVSYKKLFSSFAVCPAKSNMGKPANQ